MAQPQPAFRRKAIRLVSAALHEFPIDLVKLVVSYLPKQQHQPVQSAHPHSVVSTSNNGNATTSHKTLERDWKRARRAQEKRMEAPHRARGLERNKQRVSKYEDVN